MVIDDIERNADFSNVVVCIGDKNDNGELACTAVFGKLVLVLNRCNA